MALEWITEPEDYSGAVGSTMPVEAQTSIVDQLPLFNTVSPWETWFGSGGALDYGSDYLTLTPSSGGVGYRNSGTFDISEGTNITYDQNGTDVSSRFFSIRGSLVTYLFYLSISDGVVRCILADSYDTSELAGFNTSLPVNVSVEFESDNIYVYVSQSGTVRHSFTTTVSNASIYNLCYYAIYSATTGETSTVSNFNSSEPVNFNLKDNLGVSRVTQVSTAGSFNYTVPNMQATDTSPWTLEAESGGETIVSEFNVDVNALEWVYEPTNPNNVSIGGALNVGAEVSVSSGVDWTLLLNGEVVNEVLDSTGLYSFSSVVNPAYDGSGWLLTASCCGNIISSAFSVVVSASNSIKDTYKSGEVFDFEGTPLSGVTRLVSSFTITGQGENIIQDVYASSDDIQDVYNV